MFLAHELTDVLKACGLTFTQRAIAREIDAFLQMAKPIGVVMLTTELWVEEWGVTQDEVWDVINTLQAKGYWDVESSLEGEMLRCRSLADSAKSIAKSRKKSSLQAVKQKSIEQRAQHLDLGQTNIELQSKFAEVATRIPLDRRLYELSVPYQGWLPTDRYSAAGLIFKPDQALIDKLQTQHPDVDISLCLGLMLEDLRNFHRDRPSINAFCYWMPNWIQKNKDRVTTAAVKTQAASRIDSLLDAY